MPCPHQAHPPTIIEKTGFDLFDEGACLGGGVAHANGLMRPRIPTLRAAEACALARRLESQAVLSAVNESSRRDQGPDRKACRLARYGDSRRASSALFKKPTTAALKFA